MHFLLISRFTGFFFLFLFLFSDEDLVTHVSDAYNTCPKCGSIDVPYPLSTDDNCGDPSYKIYCKNGILEFLSVKRVLIQDPQY